MITKTSFATAFFNVQFWPPIKVTIGTKLKTPVYLVMSPVAELKSNGRVLWQKSFMF